jgi:vacuolar-type H+-ATPase subunit D/Vma8
MVSGFGYYLKNQTDLFSQNLFLLNSDLAERIKLARRLNKLMQDKNEELLEAQQFLEKEIQKRSEVLEKKNNSIEQFMMVNTSHLVDPVKDLIDTVREKESVSVLSVLLRQSADDLEKVSYSIREAIQTHPLINRQNIK